MALAEFVNQANDPFGFSKIAAEKSPAARGEAARKAIPDVLREKADAERAVMEAEREAKLKQAQEGTKVAESFERGVESTRQTLQQETGERPERNFSEFNPDAGIELAALTAILGSFAGAASGRAALRSMKGITEGYRLGQQDLYERSAKEFDYELQKHRDKYKRAKENYDLSMKSEEAKRGTAMAKLREFAPELSGTIGEAHLRNNNIPGYKNYLDEYAKFNDQMAIKAEAARLKPTTSKTASIADETGNLWLVDINQYVPGTALEIGSQGVIGRSATGAQTVAKTTAAASQKEEGARKFNFILNRLDELYNDLKEMNAITDTDKNIFENLASFTATLSPVQMGQRAIGGKAQAMRDEIKALQATLLQSIMQATGMSARSLDSNKELEFYLQAATDPTKSFQTNLSAMNTLRSLYGRLEENTYPENEQELIIIQYGAYEPQKYKYEFTSNNQITRTPLPPVKPVSPTQQGAKTSQPAAQQQGVDQRAIAIGERFQRGEISAEQAAQELRALGGFE